VRVRVVCSAASIAEVDTDSWPLLAVSERLPSGCAMLYLQMAVRLSGMCAVLRRMIKRTADSATGLYRDTGTHSLKHGTRQNNTKHENLTGLERTTFRFIGMVYMILAGRLRQGK